MAITRIHVLSSTSNVAFFLQTSTNVPVATLVTRTRFVATRSDSTSVGARLDIRETACFARVSNLKSKNY